MFQALFSFSKLIITFIAIKASFQRSCYHWNLLCLLLWKLDEIWWYRCCLTMITISVNSLITITSYFFQLFVHLSVLLLCLIQGVFFTGPALKVLSMELVPPNKEPSLHWSPPPHLLPQRVFSSWSLGLFLPKLVQESIQRFSEVRWGSVDLISGRPPDHETLPKAQRRVEFISQVAHKSWSNLNFGISTKH